MPQGSGDATGSTQSAIEQAQVNVASKYFTPDRRNENLIDPASLNIHKTLIVKQFSNRDYNFNLPELNAMNLQVRIPKQNASHVRIMQNDEPAQEQQSMNNHFLQLSNNSRPKYLPKIDWSVEQLRR